MALNVCIKAIRGLFYLENCIIKMLFIRGKNIFMQWLLFVLKDICKIVYKPSHCICIKGENSYGGCSIV